MDQPKLDGLVPDGLRPRSAKILLDSLEVQADIGFHDFEVGSPQRLLVTVEVETPRELTDEARAAVEAFRAASAEHDPRATLLGPGGT